MAEPSPPKTLDVKIARILENPDVGDFILADAKDADMAFGMAAAGQSPEQHAGEGRFRTIQEYRDLMRQNVRSGLLDIMLMSASSNEELTIRQRVFDGTAVTPAARANDTTDIHLVKGAAYGDAPSRPFRSATIDHIMCGKVACAPEERVLGADLGLYSMTFNNNLERDLETLNAYGQFRVEAEQKGFRHFLEVFDPNACGQHCPSEEVMGRFIADHIGRALAGVTSAGRPVFLKIAYHGPAAMEQLAAYDRMIIPGILGGAAGTTFDAFHQLWEARRYGARAALYGRMINGSEDQLTFIQHLRWLADGEIDDPADGVRAYHAALEKKNIRPFRPLEEDVVPTRRGSAYGSSGGHAKAAGTPMPSTSPSTSPSATPTTQGEGAFAAMSANEKIAWNRQRWDRILN